MGRHFEVRVASMQKTAAKKSKIYSRFGKELYQAAKAGIPDPEVNVELKRKIAEAKSNQVPTHVIENAIKKAKGGEDENYSEVRYEGFGPGSSTLLIDCLTDNTNRSLADVRACFNKAHTKLGQNGSVSFMYDEMGVFVFKYEDVDGLLDKLLEAEIDVIDIEQDQEYLELSVIPTDFGNTRDVLDSVLGEDYEYEVIEIRMVAQDLVTLDDEQKEQFEKLIELLEDVDDVSNVYHNVDLT